MCHHINLRRLAELYALATGLTLREVGRRAAGAHGFFFRLDSRRGCTVKKFVQVQQFFEAHWPEELAWPADIPRNLRVPGRRAVSRESELRP